jgi:hypothetical protein
VGGGQFFAKETLAENAVDGDHVGQEEGKEGEGDDNVESECGAKVDEAEDTSCYGSEIDGVVRDIAVVIHLVVVSIQSLAGARREVSLEIHFENGKHLSRENTQSSLDVVAKAVISPGNTRKTEWS